MLCAVETGYLQDTRPMQALGGVRVTRSFLCGVAGFDVPASTDDRDALDPGIEPRGIEFVRLAAGVEMQAPE